MPTPQPTPPVSTPKPSPPPVSTPKPTPPPVPTPKPSPQPNLPPTAQEPIYINCGGPNFDDGVNTWLADKSYVETGTVYSITSNILNTNGGNYVHEGEIWETDKGYVKTGTVYSTGANISNTDKPALYKTERYGAMIYSIPLKKGFYVVTLHFAEIYSGAFRIGARFFDVLVQGNQVLDDFDIFKEAGAGNKAYIRSVPNVLVDGGILTIEFVKVQQSPKISAVEIRPVAVSTTTTTTATLAPVNPTTNTTTTPSQVNPTTTTKATTTTTTSTTTQASVYPTTTTTATETSTTTEKVTTTAAQVSTPSSSYGITRFVLVDADTDLDIDGGFNCKPAACIGTTTSFNIRAETFGEVGSVRLLSGKRSPPSRIESVEPYAVFGDNARDYLGHPLPAGDYTIEAQAFPLPNAQGTPSPLVRLDFTIA